MLHIINHRQMQPDFQTASYFCKKIDKIFFINLSQKQPEFNFLSYCKYQNNKGDYNNVKNKRNSVYPLCM